MLGGPYQYSEGPTDTLDSVIWFVGIRCLPGPCMIPFLMFPFVVVPGLILRAGLRSGRTHLTYRWCRIDRAWVPWLPGGRVGSVSWGTYCVLCGGLTGLIHIVVEA